MYIIVYENLLAIVDIFSHENITVRVILLVCNGKKFKSKSEHFFNLLKQATIVFTLHVLCYINKNVYNLRPWFVFDVVDV